MEEGDRLYMTELLAQIRLVKERMEEARQEYGVWRERAQLAKERGREELVEAAREEGRRCKERFLADERVLMELEVQRDTAKQEIRASRVDDGTVERTQQLVDSLKDTPWNPQDARLDRLTKEAAADDALAALKAKLGPG